MVGKWRRDEHCPPRHCMVERQRRGSTIRGLRRMAAFRREGCTSDTDGCTSDTGGYTSDTDQVATSFRCACTLIRMPRPMNSEIIAVPPYDTSGSGTPTTGSNPLTIAMLTNA